MAMTMVMAMKPPFPLPKHSFCNNFQAYPRCDSSFQAMRRKARPRMRISFSPHPLPSITRALHESSTARKEEEEEESSFSVLTSVRSQHNEIVIVDTPNSRVLLLDSTHNIHSMLNKEQKWTGSYWDEFASLPAIVPEGPIAILGLGAGTAAHLMLDVWPSLHLEGWEIDEILIDKAREYFGLSDLEMSTQSGGSLSVHIGDALSPSATVQGGFAGVIVDLFSGGKVLPQLQEITTWLELDKRLMPNGRIMVNCGGAYAEVSGSGDSTGNTKVSSDGYWVQNATIKALYSAFPGKLSWKRMAEKESDNYLALTGPLPDLDAWSDVVPSQLDVKQWRPCEFA